jgi:hypothetical protein
MKGARHGMGRDINQRSFSNGNTRSNEANIRAYEATMRSPFFEFKADFLQWQLDNATGQDQQTKAH